VLALYEKHGKNASKAALEAGCGSSTFRDRIRQLTDTTYKANKEEVEGIAFLHDELRARGIDPKMISIKKAKILTSKKNWDAFHKDDETGEAVVTALQGDHRNVLIEIEPKKYEPEWPVIQPASPVKLNYLPLKDGPNLSGLKKSTFILPDCQIGYYRDINAGRLTPFHDLKAISATLNALVVYKPSEIVILGDFLDLAPLSRYLQVAEFQMTLQPALNYAHSLLLQIRCIVGPDCKIVYLPGNHERRLSQYILENAASLFGIKKANIPNSWPISSIPSLLRLDELNIEYLAEYPGGEYWITPKLLCTHAPEKNKDLRASLIHGHNESSKLDSHSVTYYHGQEVYQRYCVPGLGKQGAVKDKTALNRTEVPSNRPRKSGDQAIATVDVYSNTLFQVNLWNINKGKIIFYGELL
jgi:hypothetical protein